MLYTRRAFELDIYIWCYFFYKFRSLHLFNLIDAFLLITVNYWGSSLTPGEASGLERIGATLHFMTAHYLISGYTFKNYSS